MAHIIFEKMGKASALSELQAVIKAQTGLQFSEIYRSLLGYQ